MAGPVTERCLQECMWNGINASSRSFPSRKSGRALAPFLVRLSPGENDSMRRARSLPAMRPLTVNETETHLAISIPEIFVQAESSSLLIQLHQIQTSIRSQARGHDQPLHFLIPP